MIATNFKLHDYNDNDVRNGPVAMVSCMEKIVSGRFLWRNWSRRLIVGVPEMLASVCVITL